MTSYEKKIVYVHNLAFEFNWLRNIFKFKNFNRKVFKNTNIHKLIINKNNKYIIIMIYFKLNQLSFYFNKVK